MRRASLPERRLLRQARPECHHSARNRFSDTIRTIAAGGADVGFANVSTAIVGRSRGAPIISVAQLGYLAVTVLWRDETDIESLKDLDRKWV